jgi:hypothetical protein
LSSLQRYKTWFKKWAFIPFFIKKPPYKKKKTAAPIGSYPYFDLILNYDFVPEYRPKYSIVFFEFYFSFHHIPIDITPATTLSTKTGKCLTL